MIFNEDTTSLIPLSVNTRPARNLSLSDREQEALQFISGLSEDYPDIQSWYVSKVVPGLRTGTRFLLPIHRDGELVAVGIAKNDGFERKICTVRVAPYHAGRGLGLRVFDGLLKWLDDDHPGLTVSATKLPAFERIFDWYRFRLTGVESGLYVPGRQEIGYNDAIFAKKDGQNKVLEPVHDRNLIASPKSVP
ncbi:MAG: N-acetyltransferase [Rhizobiaceae bacterium]|uniref:GNAT family N-acetyltransferase n=1 Tax=unclassified Shinella TaxID=2643062 RepID=UPI00234E46D4|nr:GNAT family N-acetyltransferase [Shinella sp. YE25]MCO5085186.1 N-acetyltransferase [Rhizobiaceae bacterium]MDC7255739.1 N-acetyltransferase [Shinella sp. YE25]